jgi:transposase
LPQEATKQRLMRIVGRFGRQGDKPMKEPNMDANARIIRRHHDETFKRHAVELTLSATRTVKVVAQELGIPQSVLYRWRKLYAPQASGGKGTDGVRTLEQAEAENRQLRAEVVRMREREVVLKKSLGILSETPESGMPRLKQ